jgi:hypothetical protein
VDIICAIQKGAGSALLRHVQSDVLERHGTRNVQLHSMHFTYARSEEACMRMQEELRATHGPVTQPVGGVSSSLENFYRYQGAVRNRGAAEPRARAAGFIPVHPRVLQASSPSTTATATTRTGG